MNMPKYEGEPELNIAKVRKLVHGFHDPDTSEKQQELKRAKLACNLSIKPFAALVHTNAIRHGWYEEPRTFGDNIALIHSELSEALEAFRDGHKLNETYYENNGKKPCGIPSELADVIIRILDICEYYNIDIESMLMEKHLYNKTRPLRHGGKML